MAELAHVHKIGSDMRCECGWVFEIPPISVQYEIYRKSELIVGDAFNCDSLAMAVSALRRAADELERKR